MPPAKVRIERIDGQRMRQNTFHKRKLGLIKKAIELTVLCDCDCAILLRPSSTSSLSTRDGRLVAYSNRDIETMIRECADDLISTTQLTNAEYAKLTKDQDAIEQVAAATNTSPPEPKDASVTLDAPTAHGGGSDSQPITESERIMLARIRNLEAELSAFRTCTQDAQASPMPAARAGIYIQDQLASMRRALAQGQLAGGFGGQGPKHLSQGGQRDQVGRNSRMILQGSNAPRQAFKRGADEAQLEQHAQSAFNKAPRGVRGGMQFDSASHYLDAKPPSDGGKGMMMDPSLAMYGSSWGMGAGGGTPMGGYESKGFQGRGSSSDWGAAGREEAFEASDFGQFDASQQGYAEMWGVQKTSWGEGPM
mmetsp:Transcript_35691/g.87793  ORF Transcript_35691/g.87793 Transcript_35691/m.87793 type:complete len:365 (-) Transcript_35691:196-1290(-)